MRIGSLSKGLTDGDIYAKAQDAEIYALCLTDIDLSTLLAGLKISSPLREGDSSPSFGLFVGGDGRLCFKDFGGNGDGGDAIWFYQLMTGIMNRQKALHAIDEELGLHVNGSAKKGIPRKVITLPPNLVKIEKKETHIKIIHKAFSKAGLEFWNTWGIDEETLKKFSYYEVAFFWIDDKPIPASSLTFAYKIGDRFKIYQPKAKDKSFKWRNNFKKEYVEGLWQIKDSKRRNTLVITKAMKEIMWYDKHMNIDAICARSESELLSLDLLATLQKRYKNIVVILDNDFAGKSMASKYKILGLNVKFTDGAKNITDYHELHGLDMAVAEAKRLLA